MKQLVRQRIAQLRQRSRLGRGFPGEQQDCCTARLSAPVVCGGGAWKRRKHEHRPALRYTAECLDVVFQNTGRQICHFFVRECQFASRHVSELHRADALPLLAQIFPDEEESIFRICNFKPVSTARSLGRGTCPIPWQRETQSCAGFGQTFFAHSEREQIAHHQKSTLVRQPGDVCSVRFEQRRIQIHFVREPRGRACCFVLSGRKSPDRNCHACGVRQL